MKARTKSDKNSPHKYSHSVPVRRQSIVQCSDYTNISEMMLNDQKLLKLKTDTVERPDSGFDPKDDPDDEEANKENIDKNDDNSSPETREISRQALARQPVFKKKRILQTKSLKLAN